MAIQERLAGLLAQAAPATVAVVHSDTAWTWGQLSTLSQKLNGILNAVALGAGARVGVVLENRPQFAAVATSLLSTDRCLTTLSPLQPPERLCADIDASALPVVVASATTLALPGVRDAIVRHGRIIVLGWDGTCAMEPVEPILATDRPTAPGVAIEMLTSGTTGKPKRVQLTYGQLATSIGSARMPGKVDGNGKIVLGTGATIVSTPMVHIGGLWGVITSIYAGRRTVLLDRFTVPEWVDAVDTHKPRAAGLVPAAMQMLIDADVPPHRLASLQVVTSGTAPCPPALADTMLERYGIRVLMTYGATEFSGAVAGWTKADHVQWWPAKQGAAGRAFPGVSLRVVTDQGAELPVGSSGILEIRTAQAANGGREWVRTSDLARIDHDGFLWIEGRADDAIIRGGFKVHPAVVKAALERHPAVREAAVVGVPHERLGSVPIAAVIPRADVDRPTSDVLITACRETLTPYEVPTRITILDEFPRTAAMKVDRVRLLEVLGAPPQPVAG
ncbi:class I adenylate-forming enzyme family protein [Cryptosporangium aurantiacum]|uniref:Acyl-CoA synthetase (AMP-forming)/AMP-acid ligase II n=1 Tax=Cryptosporangium aurantiacum TaxID=134849 RepID=A0A1M7PJC8_9ACTN|nr:fatty acid--CoA ligase family protein [Cryptosporangium aurantiacum]SHN17217.1 Acyl-CoA synthetase (AMP-forming)/AMP-acid ligase II [Cryptosporangium aurantiacum]